MDDLAFVLPPKQVRSRKSIERAIEGAIEIVRESGWAGFTMAAVSERAGVSVPLLHRRFGGKNELFLAAQATVLERVERDASDFYSGSQWDDLSAAETIELATQGLAALSSRYGRLLRGFYERGGAVTWSQDHARDTVAVKYRLFRDRILRFKDEIALEDPEIAADVCFASVNSSLNNEQRFSEARLDPPGWERLVAQLARASCAFLLRGESVVPEAGRLRIALPLREGASSDDARERLIASGVDLLSEKDYRGLTAVAVSQRAGLAVGALYNVFENKEELLGAVEAKLIEQLLEDAEYLFDRLGAAKLSGERSVQAALDGMFTLVEANPAAIRVLQHRRPGADATREYGKQVLDVVRDRFRRAIVPRAVAGENFAADVCFLMVYSVLSQYVPHAGYTSTGINESRFCSEQARLCSAYLKAAGGDS